MLRVLDLFSGVGGFSLGLERTGGFETVSFCEIDAFCRRVLAKHWPKVPCYDDIRTLSAKRLAADGIARVDIICGGFPCQDISTAGKGAGLTGERSGLWSEYRRLIEEIRPAWVIIENVSALRSRGLDQVLREIAAVGYDAEWHCIPAAAVGAPHRRDRIWIVAYPARVFEGRQEQRAERERVGEGGEYLAATDALGDPIRVEPGRRGRKDWAGKAFAGEHGEARPLADTLGPRLEGRSRLHGYLAAELAALERGREVLADAARCDDGICVAGEGERYQSQPRNGPFAYRGHWCIEPDVGRVAHGVPARVDRLKSLGNAVVPQIPELIGRAILANRP